MMNEAEARRQEGEELRRGEVKCTVDWLVSSCQHQVTVTRPEVKRLNKLFADKNKEYLAENNENDYLHEV